MRTYLGMTIILLALGCNNDEELRRVYDEKLQLQTQLAGIQSQQNDKKIEIRRLEANRDDLQREIRKLADINAPIIEEIGMVETDLAAAKTKYQQLVNMLKQRRDAAVKVYNDAQKQAAEMRAKSIEAQKSGDYPYRLYNVTYIGNWRKDGITTSHGTFCIRNYSDREISITAMSEKTSSKYLGSSNMKYGAFSGVPVTYENDFVSFTVAPNSSKEKVYIRANPEGKLIVDSNLGVRRESGWKGK